VINTITTAVFPVAGMGTRFLPATKASPKEMLPLVDRPLIQYVVDEAVRAGIKKLVFVTSSGKRAIEDYFDTNVELELLLEKKRKLAVLEIVRHLVPNDIEIVYVRQKSPKGLGDAVLCAKLREKTAINTALFHCAIIKTQRCQSLRLLKSQRLHWHRLI